MNEIRFFVEREAVGGYSATALGAAIVTQADDLPGLWSALREAVRCHFDDHDRPSTIRFVGEVRGLIDS